VQEVEARAVERLRKRESRRQRNIESITIKALEALPPPDQVAEQPVSEDWTTRFFEECQDISDEQMQQIWARIMAGEVARPGSFSPRTLGIVRDLTKQDATHFANLCRFVWVIPGAGFAAVIHDHERPEIAEADINFVRLMHLTSIGLIEFNNVIGFKIKTPLRQITVSYCGRIHQLKSVDDKERIFDLGQVLFTAVGRELAKVANASGNEHYRGATLETWAKAGWTEASDG
jgi:hypothetical protein